MATYTVTRVRKEFADDRKHRHLAGVFTSTGTYFTRREVVDSIKAGNVWNSSSGGYSARIHARTYCPASGCLASPYLATNPDSTTADNLENLPES